MLVQATTKQTAKLLEEDDTATCGRHLDMKAIVAHFKKHGASGTYRAGPCRREFADGRVAT
eukprot:9378497-Karenia_brevis.AAC.1